MPTLTPSVAPTTLSTLTAKANPTTMPSSQPSASPSSRPSQPNLKVASLFGANVDSRFVLFKLNYFLGVYAGYFLVLFAIMLAWDKSKWGKGFSGKLAAAAAASGDYKQLISSDQGSSAPLVAPLSLSGTKSVGSGDSGMNVLQHLLLWRIVAAEEEVTSRLRIDMTARKDIESSGATMSKGRAFDGEFYRYLLIKRTYLGCGPVWLERGSRVMCLHGATDGLVEDLLLYICNYHKIMSCLYTVKGSPYSRTSRRIVFMMQHMLSLAILALSTELLGYAGVPEGSSSLYVQLALPPLTIFFAVLFRTIITSSLIRSTSRSATSALFLLGALVLLTFAAVSSSSESRFALICVYTQKVFLVSNIQDLLLILLMFYPRMYFALYIGRFPVLNAGRYFVEKLLHSRHCDDSANAKSFVASSYSLFGLITVEWAYNKQGSMSSIANIATELYRGSIEMSKKSELSYTENPLMLSRQLAAHGGSVDTNTDSNSVLSPTPHPPPPPPHHASPANPHAFDHSAGLATKVHALAHTTNPLLQGHHHAHPTHHHFNHHIPATEEGGSPMGITAAALHSTDESDLAHREDVLALHLRKFADDANAAYVKTVHFFQAREQGGVLGCNIDEVDMSAIEMNAVYDPYSSSAAAAAVGKRKTVVELAQMFEGSLAIS